MKILVVGAGAVGGYFGGRLADSGADVTFLVREGRAAVLKERGLVITSPVGDLTIAAPQTILKADLKTPFDVVLLSCKAYDLERCMEDVRGAVGPQTVVIPMLNGMQHLAKLDQAFGRNCVFGGLAEISSTLNAQGDIVHLNRMHALVLGARDTAMAARAQAIHAVFAAAGFDARLSPDITQSMWEKWVFLCTLAASTTLMRNSIGNILHAPQGEEFLRALSQECLAVAAAHHHSPQAQSVERLNSVLFDRSSMLTASMLRDMQGQHRIEADAVVGDLLAHAQSAGINTPNLALAYTNLKAYERARAQALESA